MHILIIPSWYPENPDDVRGVFFRDQALALSRYGHKVGVIAPMMQSLRTLTGKRQKPVGLCFENDQGISTYRKIQLAALPKIPYGNYWLFKHTARQLLRRYIEEQGKPDVLHAHSAIFAGAAGAELAEQFDIPLFLTEHSSGFARKLYTNWQLKLARHAYSVAQRRFAVSPALASSLETLFPSLDGDWHWVPNVVAERFASSGAQRQRSGPVRFLNLAVMTENKGLFELVEAFARYIRSGHDAELWLAGDGPIRSELEYLVNAADIKKQTCFLGLVQPDSVPEILAQVDVLVLASHYETFGMVAAEALMTGLPVIATRCGGPECIVGAEDGILVSPQKTDELQRALLYISQNLTHYETKSIADRAKARFSAEVVAEMLTKEYESLSFRS